MLSRDTLMKQGYIALLRIPSKNEDSLMFQINTFNQLVFFEALHAYRWHRFP